ncbi:MAG: hypothetical protein A3E98_03080 [Candidatus Doudnabacteria bacterium RIFCSPHIGHO2_12_FULL_48_11]|uniref:Shedu protein SduA C-terminal domain-containing protein n=1 Tax=Candidatus Doudnabacteria bacterium RIFCSPHIGHO2_01_FULL_46_24 TaxID=1817825 RepID=A0A1F5NTN9_9BACT|nr:MAG: hypothetical protein A2720_03635 [Candidatus Doudnabacteria bacterium RIFCSPHIGHO2_01_FULL_46_24]OGE96023.1 MAG: hypothetical protein A3E98_03080 [Candidatus Doudnabacteria bacterium RIFCSPHIGHO2_12_FULL_48_11]
MDFSKFTFFKRYKKNNTQLLFDFDIREYTGHLSKTFDYHLSLSHYLEDNQGKEIFLTLTETADFYQEDNKLVINLKVYQDFCKNIAQSGKNRTQAFLARKLKHYSESDKKDVIAGSSGDEIFSSLNPETKNELIQKLQSISTPTIVDKNRVILVDDENKKAVIEQLLDKGFSQEFWDLANTKDPELTERLSAGRLQVHRKKVIDELKNRLSNSTFSETAGDDFWQKWIYKHNWLFGINYETPIEKQKINITGIMPDYLFPTLDGFVDILEIKLPIPEIVEEDSGHPGSWIWSKEANQAIGQVVNYLGEIDRQRFEIQNEIKRVYEKECLMLKPRAFILIGQSKGWNVYKKEALRKLNHSLHGIEILTYSDLLDRGESFVKISPYE